MVHITPSPLFQIRLEESTLTMRGSQTESVGCVLRGQLVLALTEPTKFKEIKLTFQGKSKIAWLDGIYDYRNEEKILYQHCWTSLPAKKQYHVLKPNNYHWDFELILPGTLPETIEGCKHGSIIYMLKAVAERHALAFNLQTSRPITLLRSLSLSSLEILQTSVIANTLADKIAYEFSTDSKVFGLGDKIPIMINLRSMQENLKVQRILCILNEYVTYTVGTSQKTDSKELKVVEKDLFSQDVNSWNNTIEMLIPNHSARCLYDSENDIICIKHKLKFFVTIIDKRNRDYLCELSTSLPIIITSVSLDSDDMALPAYLDKASFEDHSSPTLSSSPSLCSFSESLREIELPSYRSIASLIPAPLADSLLPPTYDVSIINDH